MSDYDEAKMDAMNDFLAENGEEDLSEELRARIIQRINDLILDDKNDLDKRTLHELKILIEKL